MNDRTQSSTWPEGTRVKCLVDGRWVEGKVLGYTPGKDTGKHRWYDVDLGRAHGTNVSVYWQNMVHASIGPATDRARMFLYARSGNGKRMTRVGPVGTLDVALGLFRQALGDQTWPEDHEAVVVEDRTEGLGWRYDIVAEEWVKL